MGVIELCWTEDMKYFDYLKFCEEQGVKAVSEADYEARYNELEERFNAWCEKFDIDLSEEALAGIDEDKEKMDAMISDVVDKILSLRNK